MQGNAPLSIPLPAAVLRLGWRLDFRQERLAGSPLAHYSMSAHAARVQGPSTHRATPARTASAAPLAPCASTSCSARYCRKHCILRRIGRQWATGTAGGSGSGGSDEAAGTAEPAAPSGAVDEKALLQQALESGSDDEVAQQLSRLQHRFPTNPHYLLAAARLAARRGAAAAARPLFQRAAQVAAGQRDASVALQAWGMFESDQGRRQEARQLLQRAVAADARHAGAHNALGRLAESAGQLAAAAAHFQAAIAAEPKHAPSLQALALLEAKRGRLAKAQRLFGAAVQACPSNAQLYQAWALMEWRQGNYGAAKRLFLEGEEECLPHAPLLAGHAK